MKSLDSTPTVSVVMPAFNAGQTIDAAIGSVLAQTLPVLEIIVVDNGSTDDTLERLAAYGDRVRVMHQPRPGHAAARNLGIEAARGEWIAALDADDLWLPEKLELQLSLAAQADVIHCAARNFGETRRVGECTQIARFCSGEAMFDALLVDNFITHSAALVRREALSAVGGYDVNLRTAPDWDLWVRLAEAGYRFRGVARPLVEYRWQAGTASRANHGLNARNRLRVIYWAACRQGLWRMGPNRLRKALHGACRTSAWFAASDRPGFALRWYLLALALSPLDYATWRALASLVVHWVGDDPDAAGAGSGSPSRGP